MKNIIIRKAELNDFEIVSGYLDKLYQIHFSKMPDIFINQKFIFTKEQYAEIVNSDKFYTIVAENDEGEVIAFHRVSIVETENEDMMQGKIKAILDMVWVEKDYRKYGLGEKLLNEGIKFALDMKSKGKVNFIEFRIWGFNTACRTMMNKYNMREVYTIYELLG